MYQLNRAYILFRYAKNTIESLAWVAMVVLISIPDNILRLLRHRKGILWSLRSRFTSKIASLGMYAFRRHLIIARLKSIKNHSSIIKELKEKGYLKAIAPLFKLITLFRKKNKIDARVAVRYKTILEKTWYVSLLFKH